MWNLSIITSIQWRSVNDFSPSLLQYSQLNISCIAEAIDHFRAAVRFRFNPKQQFFLFITSLESWDLGLGTTLRFCCPCLDWVATAERSPRAKNPQGLAVPQAFRNFPYSLFHSTYFPQSPPFTTPDVNYFPLFSCKERIAKKNPKVLASTRNATTGRELPKVGKMATLNSDSPTLHL